MRQASAELFPTNEPIPASQMIGRERDVDELTSRLENGLHLWLAGPRRTGKTSVCDAVLTRCEAHGHYIAKVDLFRVGDAAELAETLAVQVIRNRSAAHRLVRATRKAGRAALSAAQATAVLKLGQELGEGVEIALSPGWRPRSRRRPSTRPCACPRRWPRRTASGSCCSSTSSRRWPPTASRTATPMR